MAVTGTFARGGFLYSLTGFGYLDDQQQQQQVQLEKVTEAANGQRDLSRVDWI